MKMTELLALMKRSFVSNIGTYLPKHFMYQNHFQEFGQRSMKTITRFLAKQCQNELVASTIDFYCRELQIQLQNS
jgi:hypothetical protein